MEKEQQDAINKILNTEATQPELTEEEKAAAIMIAAAGMEQKPNATPEERKNFEKLRGVCTAGQQDHQPGDGQ